MKRPSLTVIMPVRNGGAYLAQALSSLQAQSFRDFVIHAWDDGSDDDTAAILDRWIPDRLPGRVLGHAAIGIGPALARLVESAPTDLIARMDADDLCHPNRFSRQISFMLANPDVAVLGSQMQRRDQTLKQNRGKTRLPTRDRDIRWAMRLSNPINHPTVMMRRMAVLDCGNYRDLRPGQDDDLWLRLAYRHRFANLPEPLLIYREHEQSITANQSDQATATFRDRRLASSELVFPGVDHAGAKRLLTILTDTSLLGITPDDIAMHDQAARAIARLSSESPDYFFQAPSFIEQRANLKLRRLKSNPIIRPAWPALRQLGKLVTSMNKTNETEVQTPRQKRTAA